MTLMITYIRTFATQCLINLCETLGWFKLIMVATQFISTILLTCTSSSTSFAATFDQFCVGFWGWYHYPYKNIFIIMTVVLTTLCHWCFTYQLDRHKASLNPSVMELILLNSFDKNSQMHSGFFTTTWFHNIPEAIMWMWRNAEMTSGNELKWALCIPFTFSPKNKLKGRPQPIKEWKQVSFRAYII